MVKRALLVGCNYPGMPCELKGSANDVERMRKLLVKRFKFDNEEILQLVDTDPEGRQPTGANIRQCLRKLTEGAERGDVLFFHFSGHGTQLPPEAGMPDDTGYEECIVPSDMNLLSDDDFRDLVDKIPPGVNFTFLADACHSGGLIDSEKEQISDRHAHGAGLSPGRRSKPRPDARPGSQPPVRAGDEGLMRPVVADGVELGRAGADQSGGKTNSRMGAVGQALGSRFNHRGSPGDHHGDGEVDPQDIDAYGQQPESPFENKYTEVGSAYSPDHQSLHENGDTGEHAGTRFKVDQSSVVSPRVKTQEKQKHKKSEHTDRLGYCTDHTNFMKSTLMEPNVGYVVESIGYASDVKYMQRAPSEPMTGFADRGFGYTPERMFEVPAGRPYSGSYNPSEEAYHGPPEPPVGYPAEDVEFERPAKPSRPVVDEYGYPVGIPYERPARAATDDEDFEFPPRGSYERPLRPMADGDYSYPSGGAFARPLRPLDEGFPEASEGVYRRPYRAEDTYGRPDNSYDRYGDPPHGFDPRDEERLKYDREGYGRDDDRQTEYEDGSGYVDSRSPRYSKYPESGGNRGSYSETGQNNSDYRRDDRNGYLGRPHHTPVKYKSLDWQTLMEILSERTGQKVMQGSIRRTLYNIFGEEASPTVKFFVNEVYNNLEQNGAGGGGGGNGNGNHHGILSKIGGLASHLLKTKITDSPTAGGVHRGSGSPTGREGGSISQYIQDWYSQRQRRRSKDPGILISACEPQEMSADANPTDDPKHAYGALSNAIQTVVGQSRGFLTNREVVMAARKLLSQQGYRYQHPCLYCTDRNADRLFLCAVK